MFESQLRRVLVLFHYSYFGFHTRNKHWFPPNHSIIRIYFSFMDFLKYERILEVAQEIVNGSVPPWKWKSSVHFSVLITELCFSALGLPPYSRFRDTFVNCHVKISILDQLTIIGFSVLLYIVLLEYFEFWKRTFIASPIHRFLSTMQKSPKRGRKLGP